MVKKVAIVWKECPTTETVEVKIGKEEEGENYFHTFKDEKELESFKEQDRKEMWYISEILN